MNHKQLFSKSKEAPSSFFSSSALDFKHFSCVQLSLKFSSMVMLRLYVVYTKVAIQYAVELLKHK